MQLLRNLFIELLYHMFMHIFNFENIFFCVMQSHVNVLLYSELKPRASRHIPIIVQFVPARLKVV